MHRFNLDPSPIISSGLFAVIIAGTIAITTSGCRMGNYVEKQESLDKSSLKLYATAPTTVTLVAVINGETRRVSIPNTDVPSELSSFMTDPVYLYIPDVKTGRATFCRNDKTDCGTAIFVGTDGVTLGYSGTATAVTLWKAFEHCTEQLSIVESGQIVDPRLQVDFTIARTIEGPQCTTALTDMMNCYKDVTQCDGVASSATLYQKQVDAYLGEYIDRGVFTVDEIPQLRNIGYEVTYR